MYDSGFYDDFLYDAPESGFDFGFVREIESVGELPVYGANYIDYSNIISTNINSINDNVSAEIAKNAYYASGVGYGFKAILDREERDNKFGQESTLIIYGVDEGMSPDTTVPVMQLIRPPFLKGVFGRIYISISDRYFNGELVSQDLEDELDESLNNVRQVIKYSYWDASGFHQGEYAGTPRQIIHFIVGGFIFAEARLSLLSPYDDNAYGYSSETIENEYSNYDDGRLKPGDYFNALWDENFADVTELIEIETEFIDSQNAPLYSLLKSFSATLNVITNNVIDLFNKCFVYNFNIKDVKYWLTILNTKIFKYNYLFNDNAEVIEINYDAFGNIKSLTVDDATMWPDFGFFWWENELLQYRKRTGQIFSDIDRQVRGVRNMSPSVGDKIKMTGNVRINERDIHKRLSALMGEKETKDALEAGILSILGNSEEGEGGVVDVNSSSWQNNSDHNWFSPLSDFGWYLGSYGKVVIADGVCDYTSASKLLSVVSLKGGDSLENLHTGDVILVNGEDSVYFGEIYSIDLDTDEVTLIDELVDANDDTVSDFEGYYFGAFLVGTSTIKIYNDDSLKTPSLPLLLGRERLYSGYFHKLIKPNTLYYEVSTSTSKDSVDDLLSAEDTTRYDPLVVTGSGIEGTNAQYDYTGRLFSFTHEYEITNEISGMFPFVVWLRNWYFNNYIVYDTVDKLKAVGTTPNYVINKETTLFRTSIGNEYAPFLDFMMVRSVE